MDCLRFVVSTMCGNLQEARKYTGMIPHFREKNKSVADWCKEMASAHVTFNANGIAAAKKLVEEIRADSDANADYTAGMLAVWSERLADISAENAEVRAMIDSYK